MPVPSVRCVNCGKRLPADARTCPKCGVEQPVHVRRIYCNYCGYRIPADAALCPNCRHNPRRLYLRGRPASVLLALLAVLLLGYAALNAPVWFRASGEANRPLPTTALIAASSPQPTLFLVTATAAASPSPARALDRTAAVSPTAPPTATTARTTAAAAINQPTATRVPDKPIAPPGRPLPTLVPSPTGTPLPAPQQLVPADGTIMVGPRKTLWLSFGSTVALPVNGWFRVVVDYADREQRPARWCGWTREGGIHFPFDYWDDSSWQLDRSFRWHVDIVTTSAAFPSTCAVPATQVSVPASDWAFYWY